MRLLDRNKVSCWYALYKGRTPITDADGRLTGSYRIEYEKPVETRLNVSSAKGESTARPFGDDLAYDKTIAGPKTLPVDEQTVWWIDRKPSLSENGSLVLDENGEIQTPWDYVTRKVAPSINSMLIAISKVNHNG